MGVIMLAKNKQTFIVYTIIVILGLTLLNLISRNKFHRFDLTENKIFSLSESSKNIVADIDDLLTMKVYFSDNLPNELGNTRRYLQDILEEYSAVSDGNIRFVFHAPESNENLEEEARKDGIQPVQMQVVENDKLEIKRVYMGMVLLYEDKKETLPVIQTTTGLEYELTTKIKNLVATEKQSIGLISFGETDVSNDNLKLQLGRHYSVRDIDISQPIPDDISALLVNGVVDSVDENSLSKLDQFLSTGKGIFVAQNGVSTDIQTQQANVIQSNIFDFLQKYGLNIEKNLVMDKRAGRVSVQQQMGMFRMNVPMEYPFLPIIQNFNANESVVSGLEALQVVFPSEITFDTTYSDLVAGTTDLFSTSNISGIMNEPFRIHPDPKVNPQIKMLNQKAKVVAASSKLTSGGELILVADSKFLTDEGGGGSGENGIFILNAVDYLAGDQGLIALRSREITNRPLEELDDNTRIRWKWINILLPSLLVIGVGLFHMKREKNRADILRQIYD